jgi:threonine-phosphate decarboxylase
MRRHEHGGDLASYPGVRLDFSINLNPEGIPPAAVKAAALAAAQVAYPDPYCRELRDALSARHGAGAERIVCGNGASDLIYRICDHLRPRRVLAPAPTFFEYERSARLVGAQIALHPLDPARSFDLGDDFAARLGEGFDLVFVCQPNNPTGRLVDRGVLTRLIESADRAGAVLVVDECFLPFTDAPSVIAETAKYPNLIVLRALTKTHSLAGLRLGYAVTGRRELASGIGGQGAVWNVSAVAQAAGLAALATPGWEQASRELVRRERTWLAGQLADLGLEVTDGAANFLLFRCRTRLFEPLLERGIMIRPCANLAGLDETYWRVCVLRRDANAELVAALAEVLHG